MKGRGRTANPQPAPATSDSKLGHTRPLAHQEDERPSAQDLAFGQTIFTRRTVPLPRFLTRNKKGR